MYAIDVQEGTGGVAGKPYYRGLMLCKAVALVDVLPGLEPPSPLYVYGKPAASCLAPMCTWFQHIKDVIFNTSLFVLSRRISCATIFRVVNGMGKLPSVVSESHFFLGASLPLITSYQHHYVSNGSTTHIFGTAQSRRILYKCSKTV